MANEYNYGQKGVATDIQLGKRGPRLVANASTTAVQVTAADGTTLNNVRIADGVISSDAVTKGQMDTAVANAQGNAYNITLGIRRRRKFCFPRCCRHIRLLSTSVSQAIDDLN